MIGCSRPEGVGSHTSGASTWSPQHQSAAAQE